MVDNGNTGLTVIADSTSKKVVINEFSIADGTVASTYYKTTGVAVYHVYSVEAKENYVFMLMYGTTLKLVVLDRTTGTFTGEPFADL